VLDPRGRRLVAAAGGKTPQTRSGTTKVCVRVVDAGIDDGDLHMLTAKNPGIPWPQPRAAPMNGTLTTLLMLYFGTATTCTTPGKFERARHLACAAISNFPCRSKAS